MKSATSDVVVSEGEAVVLLNVKGTPDRRALEDWKERLEETRERLKDLPDSQATPRPENTQRPAL